MVQRAQHPLVSISVLGALLLGFPRSSAGQTTGISAPSGPSQFQGSVPTGQATAMPLDLSLEAAFQRALKYNLGGIESNQNTRAAHAVRLRALNALLPNLTARVSGAIEQVDLKAAGFNLT